MNELFSVGAIPVTPESYILQFISFVRVTGGHDRYKTVPQLIAFLKEIGFEPSIGSVEDVATLVAALENEVDADLDVMCGVILYLIDRHPTDAIRRRSTINFLLGFISSANRNEFVDLVTTSRVVPLFAGGIFPPIHDTDLGDDDWTMLFRGLVTITCQSDPFKTLDTARNNWTMVTQQGCISDYTYREVSAWTRLVTACAVLDFEAPGENQRVEKLFKGLDDETQSTIGELLRAQGKRAELLSFAEAIEALNDIQAKVDITYPWEGSRSTLPSPPAAIRFPSVPFRTDDNNDDAYGQPGNKPSNDVRAITTMKLPTPTQGATQTSQIRMGPPHQTKTDEAEPVDSFPVTVLAYTDAEELIGPSYFVNAIAGPFAMPIKIGFDSFSCITLIRHGLCDEGSVVVGTQRLLSGIAGEASIPGDTGTIEIRLPGGSPFLLTGFISSSLPQGIDVLVGSPQLKDMGATIRYQTDLVTVDLSKLDQSITLSPMTYGLVSHADSIDTMHKEAPPSLAGLPGPPRKMPWQLRTEPPALIGEDVIDEALPRAFPGKFGSYQEESDSGQNAGKTATEAWTSRDVVCHGDPLLRPWEADPPEHEWTMHSSAKGADKLPKLCRLSHEIRDSHTRTEFSRPTHA